MYSMNKDLSICASVAVGPYDVIGLNGSMPWHSKQDFYHFKAITIPYPCIFGRNTYDNMPKKPLPKRLNIVCSSKYNNETKDGIFYASTLENAIDFAKNNTDQDKIFICGGAIIYKYALEHNLIDVMYLTKIYDEKLMQQVLNNRNTFTYFPINTGEFFNPFRWNVERIKYPNGVLPQENVGLFPMFYKFSKINTK